MDRRTAPRLLAALALATSLAACGADEAGAPAAEISTDLTVEPDVPASDGLVPDELVVEDVVVGDGAEAVAGTTAEVKYVGAFYETGEEFDASWDQGADTTFPVTLGAGGVVPGFEQGIEGMQVGGRRVVTIPSELGYGAEDYGPIPGGSTLVFVIDLVAVE